MSVPLNMTCLSTQCAAVVCNKDLPKKPMRPQKPHLIEGELDGVAHGMGTGDVLSNSNMSDEEGA